MNMMSLFDLKEICKDEVLRFNRLVTTEDERNTREYIDLCYNLVIEELDELDDELQLGNEKNILKELCDLFVVKTQLKDCLDNTTWKLEPDIYYILDHVTAMAEMDYDIVSKRFEEKNLYGAILAVCLSNMTKIPALTDVVEVYGEDWEEAACSWIEEYNEGRYQDVKATIVVDSNNTKRVIFRAGNGEGKVVKWFGYKDPNLNHYM